METNFKSAFESRQDLANYGNNGLLLFALELHFQINDLETVAADALTDGLIILLRKPSQRDGQ